MMAVYTTIFCQDIELRIDPDTFCTSYQIYSMNKKARSKIYLSQGDLSNGFSDIIPATPPKYLTIKTTFSNYLLIVDAY